jgi:hypothetical protein
LRNVRYRGQRGKHLLLASISPFDRYCCKSRKSNDAENLAKADV